MYYDLKKRNYLNKIIIMQTLQSKHDQINAEPFDSFMWPVNEDLPTINSEMLKTAFDKIIWWVNEWWKAVWVAVKDTSDFVLSLLKTTFN